MKHTHVPGDPTYSKLLSHIAEWVDVNGVYPFGSRYTCTPAVLDTDCDVLVWANGFFEPEQYGFVGSTVEEEYKEHLRSYRRGKVNLIVVGREAEFLNRASAAEFCRTHNIPTKAERARHHELIRTL